MDRVIFFFFFLIKWIGGFDYFTQEWTQSFKLGGVEV